MTNEAKSNYQIAISLSTGNIVFWKEDIYLAALSTMPKTELGGIDSQKIKMKGDCINVEYYEKKFVCTLLERYHLQKNLNVILNFTRHIYAYALIERNKKFLLFQTRGIFKCTEQLFY